MGDKRYQGAEAVVEVRDSIVYKNRIPKSYRISELDTSIRKSRTKRERKALEKANALGVCVPQVLGVEDDFTLQLEYIDGNKLRDYVLTHKTTSEPLFVELGKMVTTLHDNELIHGDLTTSNCIVKDNTLYLIDFGLSFFSSKVEDKAVDLYVFTEALESTHYQEQQALFEAFLKGYQPQDKQEILERFEDVKRRGRNKH